MEEDRSASLQTEYHRQLVSRYEAGSRDSAGRYQRINGSRREPGCGDPTPLVSNSLQRWGRGTDSQTGSGGKEL